MPPVDTLLLGVLVVVVLAGVAAFLTRGRGPWTHVSQQLPKGIDPDRILTPLYQEIHALVERTKGDLATVIAGVKLDKLDEIAAQGARIEGLLQSNAVAIKHALLREIAEGAIAYSEQQVHAMTVKQHGLAWTSKDKLHAALDWAEERSKSVGVPFTRGEMMREIESALGKRDRQNTAG